MAVNRTVLKILRYGVWEFANGMLFQCFVFRFGQGKIDSYYNRQPNNMGSNQERLHRKEE